MTRRPVLTLLLTAFAALVAAWLLWGPLLGDHPLGPPRPLPPLRPVEQLRIGNRAVPEIRIDDRPLADTFDFLRDLTGLSIYINWRALEASGIRKDTPINVRLPPGRFEDSIHRILDQASQKPGLLDFAVDEGLVTVTTKEDLAKNVVTRVYDVRDFTDARVLPPGTRRSYSPALLNSFQAAAAVSALQTQLQTTIDPPSWRNNGGSVGGIRILSGQLIVTQTPENQAEIAYTLERLRYQRQLTAAVTRAAILCAASLLTMSLLLIALRYRKRRTPGICRKCGYDLRATPVRCPECGTAAA
jgi:hypothetical protein